MSPPAGRRTAPPPLLGAGAALPRVLRLRRAAAAIPLLVGRKARGAGRGRSAFQSRHAAFRGRGLSGGAQEREGDDHRRQEEREQGGRDEPVLPDESVLLHLCPDFPARQRQAPRRARWSRWEPLARLARQRIGGKEEQRAGALPGDERPSSGSSSVITR